MKRSPVRRMDIQVAIFSAILVIVASTTIFFIGYTTTYRNTIDTLTQRVEAIYQYVEKGLDKQTFYDLQTAEDVSTPLYQEGQGLLSRAREAANVTYLYTATKNDKGEFVYLLDGLPEDAVDFRYPGDAIEPEIVPELQRALAGEVVMPHSIKATDWGKIFIAYLPVHDGEKIVGVVGVEFAAEHQYDTFFLLRTTAPLIILLVCLAAAVLAVVFFRHISNPTRKDIYNTDQLTQLKSRNAFDVEFRNLDVPQERENVGIILADLNYLKRVNDELGHQYGDAAIKLVGQVFRELLPGVSVAYRVGGDEFVMLLWQTPLPQLEQHAQTIARTFLERRPDWPVKTSLAMGCAVFEPGRDENLDATYRRADKALYQCKSEQHKEMDEQNNTAPT